MSLPQRRESRSQCGLESLPSAVLARALPASTLGEAFPAGAARLRLHGRGPGRRAQLQSPRAQLGWREPRRGREETPPQRRGAALVPGRALRCFTGALATPPAARPVWFFALYLSEARQRNEQWPFTSAHQEPGSSSRLARPVCESGKQRCGRPVSQSPRGPGTGQVLMPESRWLSRSGPRGSSLTGCVLVTRRLLSY